MLVLDQLQLTFNAGKADALTAIDINRLVLQAGEFMVVLGANGSGKSTLLNLVAGSLSPDRGTITLGGEDLTRLPDYRRSRRIARVFQNPLAGTAGTLTILDNFRMAAMRGVRKGLRVGTGPAFQRQVQERVATLGMGLEDKLQQTMGTLSGGQRQALTLLMSVMADIDVLLLDEPTAALDPRSAQQVMEIADHLIRENSLVAIFVTHHIHEALRYGDRLMQMHDGQIVRDLGVDEKNKLTHAEVVAWFDYWKVAGI